MKGRTRETDFTTPYILKLKVIQSSKLELCHPHMPNKLSDLSKLERESAKSHTAKQEHGAMTKTRTSNPSNYQRTNLILF
jgi:hypothetical protein